MIAAASHWRDADIALVLLLLAVALFIPDIIEGIRNYRRGRDLARHITQEHEARKALEKLSR
jgi:hypothetical protein